MIKHRNIDPFPVFVHNEKLSKYFFPNLNDVKCIPNDLYIYHVIPSIQNITTPHVCTGKQMLLKQNWASMQNYTPVAWDPILPR